MLAAKRKDEPPVDPVALFHLGNGAVIHAVHAGADTTENGMRLSQGAMVNYLYDLSQFTTNYEQLVTEKTAAASPFVRAQSAAVWTNS